MELKEGVRSSLDRPCLISASSECHGELASFFLSIHQVRGLATCNFLSDVEGLFRVVSSVVREASRSVSRSTATKLDQCSQVLLMWVSVEQTLF